MAPAKAKGSENADVIEQIASTLQQLALTTSEITIHAFTSAARHSRQRALTSAGLTESDLELSSTSQIIGHPQKLAIEPAEGAKRKGVYIESEVVAPDLGGNDCKLGLDMFQTMSDAFEGFDQSSALTAGPLNDIETFKVEGHQLGASTQRGISKACLEANDAAGSLVNAKLGTASYLYPPAAPKSNPYLLSSDQLKQQEIAAGARALQQQRAAARARRAADARREAEEAWEREMQLYPPPLHQEARRLMAAEPSQQLPARAAEEAGGMVKRLPLRLLLRQTEVAWLWIGEARELIGGGTNLPEDTL
ncbi:unnamed protein product [Prorocentrum cordatum]|uniref:Uncharacterized protein n=1 Tax=Prorocentrum cordatum TaxID=2364126 RepID=A0ABN9TLE6_9DINO|nr:unnamed protein product [Polarella glacialis]